MLLDTNVLIYATLSSDPRHEKAMELLNARSLPGNEFFVSTQNLAEMYPNLTGPKTKPADSAELARRKITSLAGLDRLTVLPVTRAVVERALELCEKHGVIRQRYFDFQLAALMLLERIPAIATENEADFSGIPEVSAINPFR
ncbi:MAG TPA: PIN domain-containing protein [Chthoniobacterales bacterium]